MNDDDKRMAIASFKLGIISDFINRQNFSYGEKEELFRQKCSQSYNIPNSSKTTISKQGIVKWINDYKRSGNRIEGLMPKTRKDQGDFRSIDSTVKLAIIDILKNNPRVRTRAIVRELIRKKIFTPEQKINQATIYRFVKKEKKDPLRQSIYDDRRRFEAEYPNQIWQSDVMHGPYILNDEKNGKKKKVYLIAFIDDHSRLILHAEFCFSEDVANFKRALQEAISRRGIPQTLYVDNGACFRSKNLEYIGAALGIVVKHSRPYIPQGRGKIERWFRSFRDDFLAFFNSNIFLDQLNESLNSWVNKYNHRIHSSLNESPFERYSKGIQCTRPAPSNINDYFRIVEERKVKRDRTFQLNGSVYEAPATLIDRKIEVKFHPEEPHKIELFHERLSFGFANILDTKINGKIGRDWMNKETKATEAEPQDNIIKGGQLMFTEEEYNAF